MNDDKPRPTLDDLDAKLRAAQDRQRDRAGAKGGRSGLGSGMGLAFRLAIDIVAALAIGVGIGWGLDRWLGTKPWMLLLFCLLGAAAGIYNVMRTVLGSGSVVGFRRPGTDADRTTKGEGPGGPERETKG